MEAENERTVTGMAKTITGVDYEGGKVVGVTISGIIDADNDQPTSAYFQRVRHGRWIDAYPDIEPNPMQIMFMYGICSECGFEQGISKYLSYCPNCGAKMDGERI